MSGYLFLVPVSLALGLIGLGAFLWSLRHEQYDDLDGAAERVLFAEDRPIVDDTVPDEAGSRESPMASGVHESGIVDPTEEEGPCTTDTRSPPR